MTFLKQLGLRGVVSNKYLSNIAQLMGIWENVLILPIHLPEDKFFSPKFWLFSCGIFVCGIFGVEFSQRDRLFN